MLFFQKHTQTPDLKVTSVCLLHSRAVSQCSEVQISVLLFIFVTIDLFRHNYG